MFNNWVALILKIFKARCRKPVACVPSKIITEAQLVAAIDKRDKELFLECPSAFWNNPNRYQPDGTYDLFAEPYVEPKKPKVVVHKQYGTWKYVSANTKSYNTYQIPYQL